MSEDRLFAGKCSDRKIDDQQLVRIVDGCLSALRVDQDGRLAAARARSESYYNREPFGNEQEGRSRVVTGDVAEAVDSVMPSLMRVFCGGEDVVRFEPVDPTGEAAAREATAYINWTVMQRNPGYRIFHDWFKDALIKGLGVVKIWWEEDTSTEPEAYHELSPAEAAALVADPKVSVVARRPSAHSIADPLTGGTVAAAQTLIIRRRVASGQVRIAGIPPEEFLVDPRAGSSEAPFFCAHQRQMTRSQLISLGFERRQVMALPAATAGSRDEPSLAAGDELATLGLDPASEHVLIAECWAHVDADQDGIAELRQVILAGESDPVLMHDQPVSAVPFALLCPSPTPHRLTGQSLAEMIMDIQLIKSTVLRQILDNLYLVNNSRTAVDPERVNLDDLMTVRPGGIVRVQGQPAQAVMPLSVPPVGPEPFTLIGYLDQLREQRTGVRRTDPGLTPAPLFGRSATEAAILANAGRERVEMIARTFAETGVKTLFRHVLNLTRDHTTGPCPMRLHGRWVAPCPRSWPGLMDIRVAVGLGTGERDKDLAGIMTLLQVTAEIIRLQGGVAGPFVGAVELQAQLQALVSALGIQPADGFFATLPPHGSAGNPIGVAPTPPPPDPRLAAAGIRAQASLAAARYRADVDAESERYKAGLAAAVALAKAEARS